MGIFTVLANLQSFVSIAVAISIGIEVSIIEPSTLFVKKSSKEKANSDCQSKYQSNHILVLSGQEQRYIDTNSRGGFFGGVQRNLVWIYI